VVAGSKGLSMFYVKLRKDTGELNNIQANSPVTFRLMNANSCG
jgi:hypothetical protein